MTTRNTRKPAAAEEAIDSTDVDVLSNEESDVIELTSGSSVRVKHIKTLETFALVRVITRGAGPLLADVKFNREDPEVFAGQLIGLLAMSIPEAGEEAVDFIRAVVEPVDLIQSAKTKEQREHNEELENDLWLELANPEIEDTLSILEVVVRNEAPHILALGKRLGAMFNMNLKVTPAKRKR